MLRENIKKLLKERKLTATALCNQIGISQNTYYIGTRNNRFKATTLDKIAGVLGVPAADLLEGVVAEQVGTKAVKKRKRKVRKTVQKIKRVKAEPVIAEKTRKGRKPGRIKAEKPVKELKVDANEKEIKMLALELDYLKQLLKAKDELIDILKRK
jgi:transcriptional regulator with XRE-family HTH domain